MLCGNHVHVHLCLRWTESCRLTLNKDDQRNHPEGLSALLKSLGINVYKPSSAEMAEMWSSRAPTSRFYQTFFTLHGPVSIVTVGAKAGREGLLKLPLKTAKETKKNIK